jgi:DNA-binding FadR family transcriptional regulator
LSIGGFDPIFRADMSPPASVTEEAIEKIRRLIATGSWGPMHIASNERWLREHLGPADDVPLDGGG